MPSVNHIKAPPEWKSKDDWDSHSEALYLVLSNLKDGDSFAEFGSGYGSTFKIWEYCFQKKLLFMPFDTDIEWAKKTSATYIENFENITLKNINCLFVDGKPGEQRKHLIEKWANHAEIIIVHDTEPGANYVYGMADVLSEFKYRLNYAPEGKPHTTIASNHVNVELWITNHQDLT